MRVTTMLQHEGQLYTVEDTVSRLVSPGFLCNSWASCLCD